MSASRAERLAEVIKAEASEIIRRDLKDPRIGFASITDVVVSADLRHAKIFVSVLGDAEAKRRTMEGLERARGHVRSRLGGRLAIRFVPEILFRLDESIERGTRVVALMREVAEDGPREPPGSHRQDPAE
ncbi:MAG: 30S ribosome-binding factor RbfA [Armatimonadota bacterium]|nr:30S ribosome-binding factor RbfA [Armatimonadota bacterium]